MRTDGRGEEAEGRGNYNRQLAAGRKELKTKNEILHNKRKAGGRRQMAGGRKQLGTKN